MSDDFTMPDEDAFEAIAEKHDKHDPLERFEGKYKAEIKMYIGPGDPIEIEGTMVNTLELDGRWVHQKFTGKDDDSPIPTIEGRGYFGYSTANGQYEGFWIDNTSTTMNFTSGITDEDDEEWIMSGKMPDHLGGTVSTRTIIHCEDDDEHKLKMYIPGPDGKQILAMEIEFTEKDDDDDDDDDNDTDTDDDDDDDDD